jgi:hypothetical protein
MSIVESLLSLSTQEKSELEQLDPPHRHLLVAEMADKRFHAQPKWPDQADYEKLVMLLPDDGYRAMLLREDRKFPDEFRRRWLAFSLMKSLVAEWEGIVRREIPPEEFRQALDQLDPQEQWEVSRHDPDRLMYDVMKRVAQADDEMGNYAKDFVKAAELKAKFDFNFGRRGGGGWPSSGRRGPGPDGRRGPGPDGGRGPGDGGPPPGFRDGGGPRFGDGRSGPSGRPDGPGGPSSKDFGPRDEARGPSRAGPPPGDRPGPPE